MGPFDGYVRVNAVVNWLSHLFHPESNVQPTPRFKEYSIQCDEYFVDLSLKELKGMVHSNLPFLALFGDPLSKIPDSLRVKGIPCQKTSWLAHSGDSTQSAPIVLGMALSSFVSPELKEIIDRFPPEIKALVYEAFEGDTEGAIESLKQRVRRNGVINPGYATYAMSILARGFPTALNIYIELYLESRKDELFKDFLKDLSAPMVLWMREPVEANSENWLRNFTVLLNIENRYAKELAKSLDLTAYHGAVKKFLDPEDHRSFKDKLERVEYVQVAALSTIALEGNAEAISLLKDLHVKEVVGAITEFKRESAKSISLFGILIQSSYYNPAAEEAVWNFYASKDKEIGSLLAHFQLAHWKLDQLQLPKKLGEDVSILRKVVELKSQGNETVNKVIAQADFSSYSKKLHGYITQNKMDDFRLVAESAAYAASEGNESARKLIAEVVFGSKSKITDLLYKKAKRTADGFFALWAMRKASGREEEVVKFIEDIKIAEHDIALKTATPGYITAHLLPVANEIPGIKGFLETTIPSSSITLEDLYHLVCLGNRGVLNVLKQVSLERSEAIPYLMWIATSNPEERIRQSAWDHLHTMRVDRIDLILMGDTDGGRPTIRRGQRFDDALSIVLNYLGIYFDNPNVAPLLASANQRAVTMERSNPSHLSRVGAGEMVSTTIDGTAGDIEHHRGILMTLMTDEIPDFALLGFDEQNRHLITLISAWNMLSMEEKNTYSSNHRYDPSKTRGLVNPIPSQFISAYVDQNLNKSPQEDRKSNIEIVDEDRPKEKI